MPTIAASHLVRIARDSVWQRKQKRSARAFAAKLKRVAIRPITWHSRLAYRSRRSPGSYSATALGVQRWTGWGKSLALPL